MPDDLIGYLFDALEPHEMRVMAHRLDSDPGLRAELEKLRRQIEPLDELAGPCDDLPPNLSRRTMESIELAESEAVPQYEGVRNEGPRNEGPRNAGPRNAGPRHEGLDESEQSNTPPMDTAAVVARSLRPADSAAMGVRRSALNWIAATVAAAILIAILSPTLLRWREASRQSACADQMRQVGTALTQYVTRNEQRRLPAIATSGPQSFAGIYAVRLADSGLFSNRSLRWCPTLESPAANQFRFIDPNRIATASELADSGVNRLKEIQQTSGGHYAYTLGVVDREHYQSPKFEARSSFAVLADLPQTAIVDSGGYRVASGHSDGINVLYEDGSVNFVSLAALDSLPDHPLRNHRGNREAGVTIDDASLAPSWQPPFLDSRQR